ncbi:hypothetical protein A3A71_00525 [Candidatus Berkelbacteria bacterium RIFCSPLOWO2_01_FULL_50_28]|uniref:Uncharacterized protein n=1 Tax=Candidatus Berkelbacteria bacterium RIFCSPLOWO2_01_FULL_50_28 TaxID=1797471 RepID=A0A1F5EAV4_9BACT|nr:MAG: hypothetical protein A2807_00260 [Candidatus Berkelbacteria bacterium RIFCSPHIGHO2_01_FULL_50_36]OGD64528.1 MAG: hypothetical protein A3A71_00525 [Candidatus Berkelbacteria bacterium RIFCSPLOWO2_01_FULL_50_28]
MRITATTSQGRQRLKYLLFALFAVCLIGCADPIQEAVEQDNREFQIRDTQRTRESTQMPIARSASNYVSKTINDKLLLLGEDEWLIVEVHMPTAENRIFVLSKIDPESKVRITEVVEFKEKDYGWGTGMIAWVGDIVRKAPVLPNDLMGTNRSMPKCGYTF